MIRPILMALLLNASLLVVHAAPFSEAKYGAKGDGKTLDFKDLSLKVQTAGHIGDANHRTFSAVDLHVADGSKVAPTDDT